MASATAFRRVMGHFATGVTVVTGLAPGGEAVGLTVNSVTSVSLEPRLVLVCADRESDSRSVFLETGRFGISILRVEDQSLAARFAREEPEERFVGVGLRWSKSGLPFLANALAWIECELWRAVDAGDHSVLFGEVLDCGVGEGGRPLVFFQGGYGTLGS